MFFSFGFALLASSAAVPCYVGIALCYLSQAVCELDRLLFSSSLNPICKLTSMAHSPEQLAQAQDGLSTCPTTLLLTVKPRVANILWSLGQQTPVAIDRNFASQGGGANIVRGYTSHTHDVPPPSFIGQAAKYFIGYNPEYANIKGASTILEEDTNVGECWQFSGTAGHVAIQLSEPVFFSHIAIDHASPRLLSEKEMASAPQNVSLWILRPGGPDNVPLQSDLPTRPLKTFKIRKDVDPILASGSSLLIRLLDIQYNIRKPPTRQIFSIPFHIQFSSQTVIVEVLSNGGASTTCIYWVGIYGLSALK